MIEAWIDALCAVWELDDGQGGQVRSYRLFERGEMPDAMSDFPCAISYPLSARMVYGNGASYIIWRGRTELHLAPNILRSNYPEALRYFARILSAAAANATLGGKVSMFQLDQDGESVTGPVALSYGEQGEHMGLVINWIVKTNESVSVSG